MSNGDDKPNPIDELRDQAETEFADLMDELGAEKGDLELALGQIRADATAAMKAGDVEHVLALRHELPAVMTGVGIRVRGENRERVFRIGSTILSSLFGLIARASKGLLAPVLIALMMFGPGCAMMKRGTVPSGGVRGLVGEVCKVTEACASQEITKRVQPCDYLDGTSLVSALANQKTVDGVRMQTDVAIICGVINTCVGEWDDLADHRESSYKRWCVVLNDTATAAVTE
jgi:hypothetical protein